MLRPISIQNQVIDPADNEGSFLVYDPVLRIIRVLDVPVRGWPHGIESYEALGNRLAELNAAVDDSLASIKAVEGRIAELNLIVKYAATYRKFRPVYDHYRKSDDKEKFLRGHESEIILFEAAARELKRLGVVPLPAAEKLERELSELTVQKETLYAQYTAAKRQAKEYDTIKRNLDILLPPEQSGMQELE